MWCLGMWKPISPRSQRSCQNCASTSGARARPGGDRVAPARETTLRGLHTDTRHLAKLERREGNDVRKAEMLARHETRAAEVNVEPLPLVEHLLPGEFAVGGDLGEAALPSLALVLVGLLPLMLLSRTLRKS